MMDFDTFLRCFKSNAYSWYTSNFESANKEPSFISLVSNYHSYKETTKKLLPYHSFYGGHIPPRKIEPHFLTVRLKKNTKPPGYPLTSIPLKNFKLPLS